MKKKESMIDAININMHESHEIIKKEKLNDYDAYLYELFYKRVGSKGAKKLYSEIIEHKKLMEDKLMRKVNFLVAAADYNCEYPFLHEMRLIEKRLVEQLSEEAIYDTLTGLYKRGVFDSLLEKEIQKYKRHNNPLTLLMFDIDDFKVINDGFGHQEGDKVLTEIGELVIDNSRLYDIKCRYGGEELIIILPDTGSSDAMIIGERIRNRIHEFFINRDYIITVSIGVASCTMDDNQNSFVGKADKALYEAKSNGKNQSVLFSK
jgi:diguanylate cyclase (GGDEF)-like protein